MADTADDMSGSGEPLREAADSAGELLNDARFRRHYRTAATTVGIVVIFMLLLGLGRIIFALTSAPSQGLQASPVASAPAPAGTPAASAVLNRPVAKQSSSTTGASVATAADTLLNPTGAVVGLVASLTIAITVLTIALVRSTFHGGGKSEPDSAPSMPSAEVLKSVGQILESVGKAIGGRG